MKKLIEQRKGEDDNVIPLHTDLATAPKPPGDDWLRRLPMDTRFIAKPKHRPPSAYMPWYGIAGIFDKVILLGMDHEFQPGHVQFRYVDSAIFSANNDLVQVLPDMIAIEEEKPPEE